LKATFEMPQYPGQQFNATLVTTSNQMIEASRSKPVTPSRWRLRHLRRPQHRHRRQRHSKIKNASLVPVLLLAGIRARILKRSTAAPLPSVLRKSRIGRAGKLNE
jgi:hypothetical protein